MSSSGWQPFKRTEAGRYEVSLGPEDREILRALPGQLKQGVAANPGDDAFRRLFPPAYAKDEAAEKEYRELVGADLDEGRAQALDTLARTAEATELSEEDMETWLRALNGIRLWLGTVLDVSEDMDDDEIDDPAHLLYHALTFLQGSAIEALTGES